MQCPQCGFAMQEEHHGVAIDRCHSCGGLWFDADELRTVLSRPARSELAHGPTTGLMVPSTLTLTCPRCRTTPLSDLEVHGTTVQSCPDCSGVYVGPGALLSILDRQSYGTREIALDVLVAAPEIPQTALELVVEAVAGVFSGW